MVTVKQNLQTLYYSIWFHTCPESLLRNLGKTSILPLVTPLDPLHLFQIAQRIVLEIRPRPVELTFSWLDWRKKQKSKLANAQWADSVKTIQELAKGRIYIPVGWKNFCQVWKTPRKTFVSRRKTVFQRKANVLIGVFMHQVHDFLCFPDFTICDLCDFMILF